MSAPVSSTTTTSGTVEEVLAVLTSAEWVAARAQRFRDGARITQREERPGGGLLLAVSRELPEGGPSYLTRLLPKDGRVVQTDVWAPADEGGVRTGTWRVEIPGVPARLGGRLRLAPSGQGVAYSLEGEATVPLPLVGGKAERFVAEMVTLLAAKEGALLDETVRRR